MSRLLLVLLLGLALAPAAARAQSASALMEQGVRAYNVHEFDGGAWLLRRSLSAQGASALSPGDQIRALVYLSAIELARGQRDSAVAVAKRLLMLEPRYRPDDEVFPPQVVALYQDARGAAPPAVASGAVPASPRETGRLAVIRAISDSAIRPGADYFTMRLSAPTDPEVAAAVISADGRVVRTLYMGTVRDSVDLRWNGLDVSGAAVAPGRYAVSVTPIGRDRRSGWSLRVPIEVAKSTADTMPLPLAPPDSLFRPERGDYPAAWRALMPGVLASAAIIVIPKVVAGNDKPSGARMVVGGTVALAGVVAFLSHRPGRDLPANSAYNQKLRESWRRNLADVSRRNAENVRQARMIIRAGAPVLSTPDGGSAP
jgi:hypothetical protein